MALTSNLGHGHGPFRPAAFFQPSVATSDFGSLDESDYWDGGWFIATQRTVAIAVAATTLAASTANALANSHQDELAWPSYGNTGGMPQDLWRAASNTPRITYLYSNEEIVAQATFPAEYDPAPIQFVIPKPVVFAPSYDTDEVASQPITFVLADPDSVFVSIRKAPCLPEQYATDDIVPQPLSPLDDGTFNAAYVAVRTIVQLEQYATDEIVPQAAQSYGDTGNLGPDLWARAASTPRITNLYTDESIVAQPANILDDDVGASLYVAPAKAVVAEQYATDEIVPAIPLDDSTALVYVCPQRIVVLLENYGTDEIVPQAATPLDEDLWEAGRVVPPVKQLSIFDAQDEIVPQPVAQPWIEEWIEPCAVKAKPVLPTLWLADEIAPQTSTSGDPAGSLPDLWSRVSTTPRAQYLFTDEAIVPQPPPLSIDEGTWEPPFVVPATRSLYVGIQQEEIVPQPILPTSISIEEGEWTPPFVPVPVRSLYVGIQQEEIVPQPTLPSSISIDDAADLPTGVVAAASVWMPVPWQYGQTDGSIWSPLDEDYWFQELKAVPKITRVAEASDDVIVSQPTAIAVDEGVWTPPYIAPVIRSLYVGDLQDEWVVQPAPLAIDEGEWTSPYVAPVIRSLYVGIQQEEIVPQPTTIALDEGTWEPPFVAVVVKSLYIADQQDERVDSIALDEGVWTPALTVPSAKALYVGEQQDEVVPQPATLDEDYYQAGESVRKPAVLEVSASDEVIVPQPSLRLDEGEWVPFVAVKRAVFLDLDDQVIVPQPIPLHVDEMYWTAGYVVRKLPIVPVLVGEDEVLPKAKKKKPKLVENPMSRTLTENKQVRSITEKPQSRKIEE